MVATGAEIPDISKSPKGATAVVDDRFGGYEALGLAEWLATQGLTITKHPHGPLSVDLIAAGLNVKVIVDAHTPASILTAIAHAHTIDLDV